MNRYSQRDEVLRSLGFSSYAEYLRSPLWNSIRGRLLMECPNCVCGKPAVQCHHRSYKRRYLLGLGKLRKVITPVCKECHKAIEFDGDRKLSLGHSNAKLDAIREAAEARGVMSPRAFRTKRSKRWSERVESKDGLCPAHDANKSGNTNSLYPNTVGLGPVDETR